MKRKIEICSFSIKKNEKKTISLCEFILSVCSVHNRLAFHEWHCTCRMEVVKCSFQKLNQKKIEKKNENETAKMEISLFNKFVISLNSLS